MWSKRVLEAYLNALEQTRKDTEVYIGELLGMIESQKLLHGKSYTHAFEAGFAYSLSMTTQLEPYLMVMSRIKPSLSLEIRSARRHIDPNLRWRVQVVCIEHKVLIHSLISRSYTVLSKFVLCRDGVILFIALMGASHLLT